MDRICVYCGSSTGKRDEYTQAAKALAKAFMERGIDLVYGGARIGIMGTIADTVLEGSGRVFGVMPQSLVDREVAHPGLTELKVVASMHERKAMMAELSHGFIAMPGGLGTLEEVFEVLTWAQLGFQQKPIALFNVKGYFDHLSAFLDHACKEGFIREIHRSMLVVEEDPDKLLDRMADYTPVADKWAD